MQCLGMPKSEGLTLGEASRALGVSEDTLRRWDRAGKLKTVRAAANRRPVPAAAPARGPPPAETPRGGGGQPRHKTESRLSARNRFTGIVRSVEVDGVMAL